MFVYEAMNFKRGLDPMKAMNIGIHPKYKFKSFKILDFIKSFGEEGVSYTDIQKFIYFELNDAPLGNDYFKQEKGWGYSHKLHSPIEKNFRRGRGYWGTNLYGTDDKKGLLRNYCRKNKDGKWVLDHYPQREENVY